MKMEVMNWRWKRIIKNS